MNRIVECFRKLRREARKGLVVYFGAGDPDLNATQRLARAFDQAGVDILELGVPFSDPLADGLVNQLAAQRGLESGTTPAGVLESIAAIRRDSGIPIVLYIIFRYLYLIHVREEGGAPEEILLRDRPMQAALGVGAIVVFLALYVLS